MRCSLHLQGSSGKISFCRFMRRSKVFASCTAHCASGLPVSTVGLAVGTSRAHAATSSTGICSGHTVRTGGDRGRPAGRDKFASTARCSQMPWISAKTTRQRRKRTGASSCKHSTWIRAHALRGRIRGEVMSTTAQEEWAGTRTYARRLVKGRAGVLLEVVARGTPTRHRVRMATD